MYMFFASFDGVFGVKAGQKIQQENGCKVTRLCIENPIEVLMPHMH